MTTQHRPWRITRGVRWGAWWGVFAAVAAVCNPATAADDPPAAGEFKATLGRYRLTAPGGSATDADDLNLRWRGDNRTMWLGYYRDANFGHQWRVGWDASWSPGDQPGLPWQLLPSLQAASGGFVGGSLGVQVGAPYYAQFGIGRTNLRPYANLNFDPNDALTLALGWQGDGGRQAALTLIADDRLHTGQKHWHLGGRWPVAEFSGLRVSADLLHKTGLGDGGPVNAWGWTTGLDWPSVFVRVARDPKQNFSVYDAWRISGGLRF